jgi:polyisoprenoid-binding protein YceI
MDGDSTLHRWHVDAPGVEVHMEMDQAVPARLLTLDVSVPVARLTSGEAAMDKKLRDAMHADQYPEVRFHMRSADTAGTGLLVHGDLTIAGVTHPIDLDVSITPAGDGLRFAGSEPVHMRDYGVEPPVFMGVVKTAEDVAIGFQVTR